MLFSSVQLLVGSLNTIPALWRMILLSGSAAGSAFWLYWWSGAPGLSWSHYGADGGELLAAAVSNGVPHPPGYPAYTLFLQGWLAAGTWLLPDIELARLGNLFSAFCAAFSVGLTVAIARELTQRQGWSGPLIAAALWCLAPLPWSQALITEVYSLHVLAVVALGGAVLAKPKHPGWLVAPLAIGVGNHPTFLLLLPAALYLSWYKRTLPLSRWVAPWVAGLLLGILWYARIPLAAAGTPPVNWGYATDPEGFWWLVSGMPYQGYLFGAPLSTVWLRLAAWANTLATQFTPAGLALALVGLAEWDRSASKWRTFSLLWLLPPSLYAIFYNTADSYIYLLPVVWLAALWCAVGWQHSWTWLEARWPKHVEALALALSGIIMLGLLALLLWRLPTLSLRHDQAAQQFLNASAATLEPHALIVSSADAETFALWYGAWATGELLTTAPDLVLVNYSLYQFPWYRRLLQDLYPELFTPDLHGAELAEVINVAASRRPLYFTEEFPEWSHLPLQPAGPFWRYAP
jgi:hypothetical protein